MSSGEFLDKLEFKNKKEKIIELREQELPVILWGAGSLASSVKKFLLARDIKISAVLIDYETDKEFWEGIKVVNLDKLESEFEKVNVVIGHSKYDLGDKLKASSTVINNVIYFANICYEQYAGISEGFIKEHLSEYIESFEYLNDDWSKKCFIAYLNSKLNDDVSYIYDCIKEDNCYFKNELFQCDNNEIYLDLGAYTGDTIEEFYKSVDGKFEKILAFEPEEESFNKLTQYVKSNKIDNIILHRKGCWNKKDTLYFNDKKESSGITTEVNNNYIDVVDLDTFLGNEKVTLIKINYLYGVKETLEGMKNLIINNKPKIAITVGFDGLTVVEVIKFFKKLDLDYKLCLRFNAAMPARLVLYAGI